MNVKMITKLAILTAIALVLGYLESLIPLGIAPGVKLGLSNTVLLYALYLLDLRCAVLLMVLKVGLSGLLFGGFSAMAYSLAGGIASLAVMLLLKRIHKLSILGVSVAGALFHNLGQLAVACFVVESRALIAYLPILLVSAVVTGLLTGLIAKYALRGIEAYSGKKPT